MWGGWARPFCGRSAALLRQTRCVASREGGECLCRNKSPVSAAIIVLWRPRVGCCTARGCLSTRSGGPDAHRGAGTGRPCLNGPACERSSAPPAREGLGYPGGPHTPCRRHGDPVPEHGNLLTEVLPERSLQAGPPAQEPEEVSPGRSRTRKPPPSGRRLHRHRHRWTRPWHRFRRRRP